MKRGLRIFLGVLLILASVPLWKQFLVFPIGLYTTVKLIWTTGGQGNIAGILGRLTGDFLMFTICILFLYFGVKLLKRPQIK